MEMNNEMDTEMDNEMDNEIEMMMINEQATMLRLFTAGGSSSAGHQDRLQPWTLEEMAVFDAALAQHGKDFSQVAQNVNKNPTHPIPIIMITLIIHSFFFIDLFDLIFSSKKMKLPSKSVMQCVQFYYVWKKLCRAEYQAFKHQRRSIHQLHHSSPLIVSHAS